MLLTKWIPGMIVLMVISCAQHQLKTGDHSEIPPETPQSKQPEQKIQKSHPLDQTIPVAEQNIVQQITAEGVDDRFVIPNLKPKTLNPVGGHYTIEQQDANTIIFYREFSDDYVVVHGIDGPLRPQLDIGEGFGQRTFGGRETSDELPIAYGTICRFKGSATLAGYKFTVEPNGGNRLSFAFIDGVGFVYLRGKGTVTTKSGKEVSLGY